jgi:[ribosomal protein S18]-alanine N-acetyltransferase
VPYRLERMQVGDIPAVIDIEHASFSMTWPANSYKRELEQNQMARYVVVRYEPGLGEPPIAPELKEHKRPFPFSLLPRPFDRTLDDDQLSVVVGYGGLWLMVDEAHVTSVAVRPEFRGRGLGELLMVCLLETAIGCGVRWVTLEVRMSNTTAQSLYRKLGFRQAGIRPRYYTDNNEDAVVMWSEELTNLAFREGLARIKRDLEQRLRWVSEV